MAPSPTLNIGILLYPDVTQLDATGPEIGRAHV